LCISRYVLSEYQPQKYELFIR